MSFPVLFFARVYFCVLLLFRLKYIESAQLWVEYSIYSYRTIPYDTDTVEKSISSVCQMSADFFHVVASFFVARRPS